MEFTKQDFEASRVAEKNNIVQFVREVKKYPCLYDRTLHDHSNRIFNSQAWTAIAKRCNSSVPYCKDKWRKIRISFARSLKLQQSDKGGQPYYLSDELQFLLPFIKHAPTPNKEHKIEFEEANLLAQDSTVSDYDSPEDSVQETVEIKHNINNNDDLIPVIGNKNDNGRNGIKRLLSDNFGDRIDCSPRKLFLFSLLPEIESFSETEMRIFRRQVINVVDDLINKRDNVI